MTDHGRTDHIDFELKRSTLPYELTPARNPLHRIVDWMVDRTISRSPGGVVRAAAATRATVTVALTAIALAAASFSAAVLGVRTLAGPERVANWRTGVHQDARNFDERRAGQGRNVAAILESGYRSAGDAVNHTITAFSPDQKSPLSQETAANGLLGTLVIGAVAGSAASATVRNRAKTRARDRRVESLLEGGSGGLEVVRIDDGDLSVVLQNNSLVELDAVGIFTEVRERGASGFERHRDFASGFERGNGLLQPGERTSVQVGDVERDDVEEWFVRGIIAVVGDRAVSYRLGDDATVVSVEEIAMPNSLRFVSAAPDAPGASIR